MALKDLDTRVIFQQVYSWRDELKVPTEEVCEPAQILLRQMNQYAISGKTLQTNQVMERLKNFIVGYQKITSCGIGEVHLQCAYVALIYLDNPYEALGFLEEAIQRSTGSPYLSGIVYWLKGCVLWETQQRVDENNPLYCWQRALHLIKDVRGKTAQQEETIRKYRQEMKDALNYAVENDGPKKTREDARTNADSRAEPTPPPHGAEPNPTGPRTNPPDERREAPSESRSTNPWKNLLQEGYLALFPYVANVQAGVFSTSDPLINFPLMEINGVMIENKAYRVYAFPYRKTIIDLAGIQQKGDQILLLKVDGDSMDQAGILKDDFVLVQRNAEIISGNIVVAEKYGDDGKSKQMVKRLLRKGNRVILHPESSNHEWADVEYDAETENFHVWGQVLAVLKEE